MYDNSNSFDRRSAFSAGDIDTASPRRVLLKCFDRLDADLDRGMRAIEANDHETANRELGHAQDLLGEVAGMLQVDAWEHAGSLLAVYDYVLRLLAVGSMLKELAPIAEARHLLGEIGDGFRGAADAVEAPATSTNPSAPGAGFGDATGTPAQPTPRASGFSVLA